MDASQFLIVLQHFRRDFACHLVLRPLVSHFCIDRTAVPLRFVLSLSFCLSNSFDEALLRHSALPSFKGHVRLGFFLLVSLVPLVSQLLLPVRLLLNFIYSVFYHSKSLSYFKILHIFLIVQFVCEFQQLINLVFFFLFRLLLSDCPSRLWFFLFFHRFLRDCLESSFRQLSGFRIWLDLLLFCTLFLLLERFYFFALFFGEFFEMLGLLLSQLFLEHDFFSLLIFLALQIFQKVPVTQ